MISLNWQPIDSAPQDRPILVYAPPREGLSELYSVCQYHPDAGFCIDELREPTHYVELSPPPLYGITPALSIWKYHD